jgi:hypothetical protein
VIVERREREEVFRIEGFWKCIFGGVFFCYYFSRLHHPIVCGFIYLFHLPVITIQVNDPTIPGPFHLWPLRKALSNGPPCRLRRAPLTLLAYPDWRQWRPGALATASASSADTELDERDLIDEVLR